MFFWGRSNPRVLHMLNGPLRWPRMTTRRLMVLVALIAIGIWGATELPRTIEQMLQNHRMAEYHAYLERTAAEKERESSIAAEAFRAQFDEWRHDSESADELTQRYFESHREFWESEARYQRNAARYEASLKERFRWATWLPWQSAAPAPAVTRDPPQSPPPAEPGKNFEITMEGAVSAAFAPGGCGLALGCRDHTIRLLQLPSRRLLAKFAPTDTFPHAVIFSPDGKTVFAAGDGRFVRRWNVATARAREPIAWSDKPVGPGAPDDFATALDCSADGAELAAVAEVHTRPLAKRAFAVRLLETRTGERKWEYKGSGSPPHSVEFLLDGQTLAFASGPVLLVNRATGNLKRTLRPSVGHVIAVAISPDGRTLAGAGADTSEPGMEAIGKGRVTLWDISTGAIRRTLEGPAESALAVSFSPDGKTIAAGGRGPKRARQDRFNGVRVSTNTSEVRQWEVETGNPLWTAEGESNSAFSLCYSADGSSLAFCDEVYVFILDARTGRLKQIAMETVRRLRLKG
jgi:WD40 repeat protein